jgi:hypothetical protein
VATVTIDDELGHLLTRVASARGKTLEQFADEALRPACGDFPYDAI